MTKKIEHLRSELQDFFPEQKNEKLQTQLEYLSDLKKDFISEPAFRIQLKTRLENMYTGDNPQNFSLITLFRFTGVFASLFFVSGASYLYYMAQQETGESLQVPYMQETSSSLMDTSEYQGEMAQEEYELSDASSGDMIFQGEKKEVSDTHSSLPSSETSFSEPITEFLGLPSEISQPSQKKAQTEDMSESGDEGKPTNSIFSDEQNKPEVGGNESSQKIHRNTIAPTDEYILPQIFDSFGESDQGTESSLHETLPASDMIETFRMSVPLDPFIDICSSYSGSLSDDMQQCMFHSGETCTRENVFSEGDEKCEFLEKKSHIQK